MEPLNCYHSWWDVPHSEWEDAARKIVEKHAPKSSYRKWTGLYTSKSSLMTSTKQTDHELIF